MVGGFRLKLNSDTQGSIPMDELFDTSGLQAKVDNGLLLVDQKQQEVNAWWNGLTPLEQQNPANKFKYNSATEALDKAGTFLGNMDSAINGIESSTVQYSLDKRPKDMWNFVVGSQYQHSKHWMLRVEYGFLGSRTQVMAGLQYRFGL